MNTKLLSQPALEIIDQYLYFRVGAAECNVPYFNNKHSPQRAALRAMIGKGSPREIFDEVEIEGAREHIVREAWTGGFLKRFMCDHDIGIDCSGLAYYIMDAESRARIRGSIDRHLSFPNGSMWRKLAAKFRPVENADVLTFASDKNSWPPALKSVEPGDFITIETNDDAGKENRASRRGEEHFFSSTQGEPEEVSAPARSASGSSNGRNHILVMHAVDYQNFLPTALHYTHSIAWPDDGELGHGVRQGVIEILDASKPLVEQKWIEKEKTGVANETFLRAKAAKTEIRRLKWW